MGAQIRIILNSNYKNILNNFIYVQTENTVVIMYVLYIRIFETIIL